jgi:hypothetical protein
MKSYTRILVLSLYSIVLIPDISWSQSVVETFLKPSDSLNIRRKDAVIVAETAFYLLGMIQMNAPLNKEHFNSKFNFVDDNSGCLQMDKANHIFTSYQIGNAFANALKWSGVSKKDQLIYGAGMGFVFLNSIELVDGFTKKGASYGDIIANGIGTSLFVSQELLWKEQRIIPKWSGETANFICLNPEKTKAELMGELDRETVWLSLNLHSFFKGSKIPKWLNFAIGYGEEGSGFRSNNQGEYSQIYFSFDVDLTKIETKSHFLKTMLFFFNTIKIPSPTFEINGNGKKDFHYLFF